jgi:hypothetical protein
VQLVRKLLHDQCTLDKKALQHQVHRLDEWPLLLLSMSHSPQQMYLVHL